MKTFELHGVEVRLDPEIREGRTEEALDEAEYYIRWRFARPQRVSFDERDPSLHRIDFAGIRQSRIAARDRVPYRDFSISDLTCRIYGFYGFDPANMTSEDIEEAMRNWTEPVYVSIAPDGMLWIDD